MSSTALSENSENTCVVCFKNVSIFSIGDCDHPVCYECSTRMRVLCRQNECPICRQDMPKVIFTKNVRPFRNIKNNAYFMDKKFKICFDNQEIQAAYSKLLEHVCKICPGWPAFRTFQNLKDHMRKEHELFYCDLCVDNLKIFTGERRCYTRQELAQHRRKGDPDDRSHRGHPLCEFCDQRYMDNDELFRHLRRDHLFCHFCDADGYHQYYSSYDYLRDHFRADHFLCEEGGCVDEKFTSAFRSEIDLKAHRASVHGRSMGKAAAKQARTLELEFTLAPRAGARSGRSGRGMRAPDDSLEENCGAAGLAGLPAAVPDELLRTHCPEEFPSLGGASAILPVPRPNGVGGLTIRAVRQQPLAVTDENFPALGGAASDPPPSAAAAGCKTVRLSVNSERAQGASSAPTNLSIRVNHRPDGAVTTCLSSRRPVQLHADDFPSLSGGGGGGAPAPAAEWLAGDRRGRPRTPQQPPAGPPPKLKTVQEDFPSLSAPTSRPEMRSKKASSVIIPVTQSWPASNGPANGPGPEELHEPVDSLGTIIKLKSKKKKPKGGGSSVAPALEPGGKVVASAAASVLATCKYTTSSSANDSVIERGKRKKKEEAAASGEDELTSKLEGILTCRENSAGDGSCVGAAAAAERKRSELLIASLRRSDLPALGCPPGFTRPASGPPTQPTPPPGFGPTAAPPPPGFSSVTLSSVARPTANGLTFTNSSGQSYPILPAASIPTLQPFVPPRNAERRNQALVTRVREHVADLSEFLQLSALYRQGGLPASAFYGHCQRLLGSCAFANLFPEMLVLLPDITKQQELLAAHEAAVAGNGQQCNFRACATCGQVLDTGDLPHHQATHRLANRFASVVDTAPTTDQR